MSDSPDRKVDGDVDLTRLIHPSFYKPDAPEGERLQPGFLRKDEFKITESNSGASVYALELEVIRAGGHANWQTYGSAVAKARTIRELGFEVVYTPKECPFIGLADGHISIVPPPEMTRVHIDALRDVFVVVTPPTPPAKK